MIEATKIQCFETILGAVVDHEEMVVKNVSMITEGVAKGHGVLIDKTTLEQMKDAAEQFDGGLKVKIDHFSGFNGIVGTLRKFRIKGKKLLADLHLLKNHSAAGLILEMADTMADTFGLSASFSGVDEEIGGHTFARVNELYSADLVDQPAANPSGLFEEKKIDTTPPVETKIKMSAQTQAPTSQSNSDLEKQIAALTETVQNFASRLPKEEKEITDETPLSELNLGAMRDIIQKEMATQMASSGWKPTELSADPKEDQSADRQEEEEPKTFQAVISKLVEGGMSKPEAISFAVRRPENHQLYSDWKNQGGQAHL